MAVKKRKKRVKPYDPTPSEIAEGCRQIQKGWTEEDFRMRAGYVTKVAAKESMQWRPGSLSEEEIDEMLGRRDLRGN